MNDAGPRALYRRMMRALGSINACERSARNARSTEQYVACMCVLGLQMEYAMREVLKQIQNKKDNNR